MFASKMITLSQLLFLFHLCQNDFPLFEGQCILIGSGVEVTKK